ncbi:MAG: YdbH domain-containing protein [Nitrospira sp.]
MTIHGYRRWPLMLLLAVVSLYLLLPLTVSFAMTQWLRQHGYRDVIVQFGYPGWRGLSIPVVSFQLDVGDESVMIAVTDIVLEYHLSDLFQGRVGRVVLPYIAVQILTSGDRMPGDAGPDEREGSPWNLLTAGDLLRRIPVLPFREIELGQVTVFREQATGPLRKVTVRGTISQEDGELGGQLTFQGRETASYGLTVSGHSASTWTATLISQRAQASPIVSWQSTAESTGAQVRMSGKLEINVRELAPFIALIVPIGPELERVSGRVAVKWTGTAAAGTSLQTLREDPQTTFDGTFQSTIGLPALKGIAKQIVVSSSGTFTGTPHRFSWTVDPEVLLSATLNMQPRFVPPLIKTLLPQGDQPVYVEPSQPLHGLLDWTDSPFRMTFEGPVTVTYGAAGGPLVAEFTALKADLLGENLESAQGTFWIEGTLPAALASALSVKEAVGAVHGDIAVAHRELSGNLASSSTVTVKHLHQGNVIVPKAVLSVTEALPVRCRLNAPHCSAGPGTLSLRVPTIHLAERDVKVGQGTLTVQAADYVGTSWNVQGTLNLGGVAVESLPISATDWRVTFSANQAGVKAEMQGQVPTYGPVVAATGEYSFTNGAGGLRGKVGTLKFDNTEKRLSKLVPGLSGSIDVTDGEVTVSAEVGWSKGTDDASVGLQYGALTLAVDRLSGSLHEIAVQGVGTKIEVKLSGTDRVVTVQPASIAVASIQTGIEVTNLGALMELDWRWTDPWPTVDLREMQATVFGGTVTSPGVRLDPVKLPSSMTVSLRQIDLEQVLRVEGQKGLAGSGLINGTIPITVSAAGVSVKDGTLEAQPPGGMIRYVPGSDAGKLLAESDQSLRLVAQALNNFHYDVLRGGVQYAHDGLLHLSIRLEGRNPDMKKSPLIHFNLTVQENIPALLKSLRLVQDIEDTIKQRVSGR